MSASDQTGPIEPVGPVGPIDPQTEYRDVFTRGTHFLQRGDHVSALPLLERAHALAPENADALLNLGGCLVMAGKFKRAHTLLEQAVLLHPGVTQLWVNLGAAALGNPVLATDEKQQRALQAFEHALTLDPFAPNIEYNIGLIQRDRGELRLAINAFKLAADIDPNDTDARRMAERLQTRLDESARKSDNMDA